MYSLQCICQLITAAGFKVSGRHTSCTTRECHFTQNGCHHEVDKSNNRCYSSYLHATLTQVTNTNVECNTHQTKRVTITPPTKLLPFTNTTSISMTSTAAVESIYLVTFNTNIISDFIHISTHSHISTTVHTFSFLLFVL